jgi:hypothetical protein
MEPACIAFCASAVLVGVLVFPAALEGLTHRSYWGPEPYFSLDREDLGSPEACMDLDSDGTPELITVFRRAVQRGEAWSLGTITRLDVELSTRDFIVPDAVSDMRLHVLPVGDVDGDGWSDLGSSVSTHATPDEDRGAVYLFSGRTGDLVQRIRGDERHDSSGLALSPAGDVDGDGKGDVLLGGYSAPTGSGRVRVLSVATAQVLATIDGEYRADQFGACFAKLGDLDGDGWPEIAVGSPGADAGLGRVSLVSSRTGERLWRASNPSDGDFGDEIRLFADRDGDGVPELACGAALLSGRSGGLLEELDASTELLGSLGDWDSDGSAEILEHVWAMESKFYDRHVYSRIRVRSAKEDAVLLSVALPHPFPRSLVSDDLDGDGLQDVILEDGRSILAFGSSQLR